jgi:vitamin B12 transporter
MSRKSRITTLLGLLSVMVMLTGVAHGQSKNTNFLSGKVTDEELQPLEGANVQLVSTNDGDVTNTKGYFHFTTSITGKIEVRASMIGYEPAVMSLNLELGDSVYVELILREGSINLKEVLVTASAYTTGEQEKGVTLQSLEVVTTPGAAADIFKALQTFPGVISVDEGSGLFVRGGDVSETVVVLDQATVMHPYKYESPTGGFFGTIPPFLISGTYFSSGGFSARYGNALSAVLAMESRELPSRLTFNLGLGLAAGSVGADVPVISDKLGIQFSANQSFTDLMFRLNGVKHHFTLTPRGSDANMNLIYKYSTTGQVKLFNYLNTDRIGVRVDEPSFFGVYESDETNWLHNIQWKDVIANWLIKTSISLNRFDTERKLGNLNLKPSDYTYKLRVDAERMISENHRLSIGAEQERMENRFEGTIPQKPTELDPNADVFRLDERYATNRFGAYTELESQLSRRWIASAGLRWDHHNITNESVFDPRTSLLFNLSKEANIRLSWGLYHQFTQPIEFNGTSGNPNLNAQRAKHIVIGFEHSNDLMMLRFEAYRKTYADLILPTKITNYENLGDGYAQGLDFFLKYGSFLLTPFSGWVSYSYLHSRRLQSRDLLTHYKYEEAPSSFDITHNLTIVAKIQMIQFLNVGFTLHYATGRPVTPIAGAVFRSDQGYYEPIQGPINSERLPDFIRLDGSVSYFLPFGSSNSAVFYLGLSNLLNRANPVRYEYSFDYSERRLRTTDYKRFIYFGATISFGSFGMES